MSWVLKFYIWASNSWKWKKINRFEESRGKNEDIIVIIFIREIFVSVDIVVVLKFIDGLEDSEGLKIVLIFILGRIASVKIVVAFKLIILIE